MRGRVSGVSAVLHCFIVIEEFIAMAIDTDYGFDATCICLRYRRFISAGAIADQGSIRTCHM